jgi:hypothetical protein
MQERLIDFAYGIQSASPAERLAFNRWLISRDPSIQFLLHPGKQIELLVGGVSQGLQPLAPGARKVALQDGYVDPVAAFDHPFGSFVIGRDDEALKILSQEQLEKLKTGASEERWEVWKILEADHLLRFGI